MFQSTMPVCRSFGPKLSVNFAAFEFLHGQGLGVLGCGRSLPKALEEFFTATRNPNQAAEVRRVYARLGTALQAERALVELSYKVSRLETKTRELDAHIENCTQLGEATHFPTGRGYAQCFRS